MGLGFVVVLEKDIEGVDPRDIDGRVLARHRHTLDALAHEEDLPGLGEFVAFSAEEAETLAADMKFDAPPVGTGRWFDSAKGLEVVHAIRDSLRENPDEIKDTEAILDGLDRLSQVLDKARAADTRFRLSIDY